jgi:hypothetical protein
VLFPRTASATPSSIASSPPARRLVRLRAETCLAAYAVGESLDDPKRAWAKCGGVSEIATTLRPWGYSIGSSARGGNASRVKPIALMTFGSTTRLNLLELNRQVARRCCRAGCGQKTLSVLLNVRRDTVRDWRSGRNPIRPQVWSDLLSLITHQKGELHRLEAEVRELLAKSKGDQP